MKRMKEKDKKKSDGKWHDRQTVAVRFFECGRTTSLRQLKAFFCCCFICCFFLSLSPTFRLVFVFVDAVALSDACQYKGNFPGALIGPRQRLK